MFHKIVEPRILVDPWVSCLAPESVIEPTGVIRRELGLHGSQSSRVGD